MAKKQMMTLTSFDALYEVGFHLVALGIESASKRKIVATDMTSGDQVTFAGKNLRVEHGVPANGIIEKMTITGHDGDVLQVYSHLKINPNFLGGSTFGEWLASFTIAAFLNDTKFVGASVADSLTGMQGDDILLGRGGDDTLRGGRGRDQMNGGSGNDIFVFVVGDGSDTIRDFDADPTNGQDHIMATFPGTGAISQVGANTVINFGNGDRFTLLNVDASTIDGTDFL